MRFKMDNFNRFIQLHFKISLFFLATGLLFGIIYSVNLLGVSLNSQTLLPSSMRSLHISLMLYGFVTLMLSFLPFLLINKEVGSSDKGLHYLNLYCLFWYIFLIYMSISLLFGNTRGLAFYDFPYPLNFILALAGIFYAIALYRFIKQYSTIPTWVSVSFKTVLIAPVALLILMNPIIGQVERTVSGPHGDNTLGMSLALIPLYYLIIKLLSKEPFYARWNIFWIIPTAFYAASVLYRTFFDAISYNQEWFLQYLTLLYIPLLYKWYSDATIEGFAKKALLISILAFLFVDVEGNILFIPALRWVFHRNDLIVAHAHVAMGIGVFFMVIAMFANSIKELGKGSFYKLYLFGIIGIFIVLTLSGFVQAGYLHIDISTLWLLRTLCGILAMTSLVSFISIKRPRSPVQFYHLAGLLNDGLGGVFLLLFASYIYPLFGFSFSGVYEYVVFAFVTMTGVIHLMALLFEAHEKILAHLSIIIRIFISALFFALYSLGLLGMEALIICLFDFLFASFYLIFLNKKGLLCQE